VYCISELEPTVLGPIKSIKTRGYSNGFRFHDESLTTTVDRSFSLLLRVITTSEGSMEHKILFSTGLW